MSNGSSGGCGVAVMDAAAGVTVVKFGLLRLAAAMWHGAEGSGCNHETATQVTLWMERGIGWSPFRWVTQQWNLHRTRVLEEAIFELERAKSLSPWLKPLEVMNQRRDTGHWTWTSPKGSTPARHPSLQPAIIQGCYLAMVQLLIDEGVTLAELEAELAKVKGLKAPSQLVRELGVESAREAVEAFLSRNRGFFPSGRPVFWFEAATAPAA